MEPAATIIKKLGGAKVVADITERALTAPYRWQHPRQKGGTGGLIPQKYHRQLLAYARQHGIALRASDFAAPDDVTDEASATAATGATGAVRAARAGMEAAS